ncbi:MAG: HD domain-containing protein, partial [Candidatus Bathyarchaeia archaeon]
MKMMEELTLVDPLTFEIKKVPYRDSWKQYTYRFLNEAVQEIRGELKGKDDVGKLKIICDYLVEELPRSYWSEIPAQNSFPGFFSSLADHAIATSTIGVALAVECRLEGIDFAKEYKGKELESLLNDAAGLIQVVRLACLLHDAGKPLQDHELKTREVVEKFLSDMGFGALSKELAELASKHHYGAGSEHPPTTMLEWVIAYADKVAVQDRSTISPDPKGLAEALRKLHLDTKDKRILEVAETLEAESPLKPEKLSQTMRLLLPVDEEYRKTLDRELLNAPGRLKIDEKPLAVLLLEAQGIQDIVRRSEALKGLMGYSAMVELGMEEAADVIRNRLAPESIVFIGGGSLLAIVPSGLFEEIKKEASRKYSEFVKGAGVLKAPFDREPVSFSLYELKNGPGFAWSAFVSYPGELSPRSFGQVFNIAMQTLEPCEAVDPVGGELRLKPSGLCTVCRMEEGLSTSPDGERLGQVCKQAYDVRNRIMEILQKPVPMGEGPAGGRLRGGDPKLNKLPIVSVTWRSIEKLSERIRENAALSEALKGKTLTYNLVSTIDHLGRQMERALKASQGGGVETTREVEEVYDIAVIKGDGDNFGMIKSSMVNLTGYRHVSNLFKEVIEEGLAEALSAVMLRQIELSLKGDGDNFSFEYPFLIIYAGGDDFLLLLDAPASLIFLESFNRYLERRFKASRNDYALGCSTQFLGVSLGLAVMRNRMPIYAALEAVEELEDKAKKDGKTRTEKFGSRI